MRLRPTTADDHDAVLDLLAERDRVDFGQPDFTRSLLVDQWRSREFSPAEHAVVAEDDAAVIGYAAVFPPGDLAFVHPAREGRGIGTRLREWAEGRARTRGTFRQRVPARNHGARSLLESAGYLHVRSVHYLAWSGESAPPEHAPPAGIALEPIRSDRDLPEIHRLDQLAFSENPDYHEESFESFFDEHIRAPDVHAESSRVARRGGQTVGFVLCRLSGTDGYVDLLAVSPQARRVGLGRALLSHALSTLARDGAGEICLDVSSDNAKALSLYRSMGMRERHEVAVFEKAAG